MCKSLAHSLLCCLLLVCGLRAQRDPPLPGSRPGTERWVVQLNSRGFDLQLLLQQIRATTSATQRATLIAQLDQLAAADQLDMRTFITGLGGTVAEHLWVVNGLIVEVTPAMVTQLRQHPRLFRLSPDRARRVSDVVARSEFGSPPSTIATTTDANNHNVPQARSIILSAGFSPAVSRGLGPIVGFFDTGIDSNDLDPATGLQNHPAFVDASGNTRIAGHIASGVLHDNSGPGGTSWGIDCNSIGVFNPCSVNREARHGTGVAGIAVGSATSFTSDGHAPGASILDVSISMSPGGPSVYQNWRTTDTIMLGAIKDLRSWILAGGDAHKLKVLNISFDGWSFPSDPVPLALDHLAQDEDILIVTSAGNAFDETWQSHGFYNGLAVGAVHTRTAAGTGYVPMPETSRGPLTFATGPTGQSLTPFQTTRRAFPDVCATGAGIFPDGVNTIYGNAIDPRVQPTTIEMPMIDMGNTNSTRGSVPCNDPLLTPLESGAIYYGRGTSMAAPQVTGAAALYRAVRTAAHCRGNTRSRAVECGEPIPRHARLRSHHLCQPKHIRVRLCSRRPSCPVRCQGCFDPPLHRCLPRCRNAEQRDTRTHRAPLRGADRGHTLRCRHLLAAGILEFIFL